MKNINKNQCGYASFMLLDIILAQWWRLVASSEALDLLHQAMCAVLYQCTATAIKMASKVGLFLCCGFICCCPSGSRGNTEQAVAQWQHPVASGVALDMPHWAMPSVLPRCTAMANEIAKNRGAFVWHCRLFCMIIRSYKTMLWSIKTNAELQ
jgi:hypothetical protein